jgi:hypothetical protein
MLRCTGCKKGTKPAVVLHRPVTGGAAPPSTRQAAEGSDDDHDDEGMQAGRTQEPDAAARVDPIRDNSYTAAKVTIASGATSVHQQMAAPWCTLCEPGIIPSCTRSISTDLYLCHACSCHEILDGDAWTGVGGIPEHLLAGSKDGARKKLTQLFDEHGTVLSVTIRHKPSPAAVAVDSVEGGRRGRGAQGEPPPDAGERSVPPGSTDNVPRPADKHAPRVPFRSALHKSWALITFDNALSVKRAAAAGASVRLPGACNSRPLTSLGPPCPHPARRQCGRGDTLRRWVVQRQAARSWRSASRPRGSSSSCSARRRGRWRGCGRSRARRSARP